MKKSNDYFVILGLLVIALAIVVILSIIEILVRSTCPPVFGIPACYILTVLISAALISHVGIIEDRNILFFLGTSLTLGVAVFATFSQVWGFFECPELFALIPMCYLSLILFSSVIILKLRELRAKQSRT